MLWNISTKVQISSLLELFAIFLNVAFGSELMIPGINSNFSQHLQIVLSENITQLWKHRRETSIICGSWASARPLIPDNNSFLPARRFSHVFNSFTVSPSNRHRQNCFRAPIIASFIGWWIAVQFGGGVGTVFRSWISLRSFPCGPQLSINYATSWDV